MICIIFLYVVIAVLHSEHDYSYFDYTNIMKRCSWNWCEVCITQKH